MTPLLLLVTLALASECLDCEVTGLVQWGRNRREERRESRRHRREYRVELVQKPNVLVILIDDLGFNQVGYRAQAAGNEEVKTPRIDELAGNGIKLDRFYATPWCAPSRGALQTGRLDALNPNVANNVWNFDAHASYEEDGKELSMPFVGGVQPGSLTLGDRFQEMGYATHLNGKWGIGGGAFLNTPAGMGYESFMGWFGDSMESCDGAEPGFAMGAGSPDMDNLPGFWFQDLRSEVDASWCGTLKATQQLSEQELLVGCKSFKQELDDVADEMIRKRSRQLITEHDYEKAPLFLVHALQLMHLPMQYPMRFADPVANTSNPKNEDLRAATYGALRYVDWVVGDLIDALKEQGQYDNTIVFLSSDNGGAIYAGTANNNYPLRGGKFNNFGGGQRVNAFLSGGWIECALRDSNMRPFTSETVVAINDVPETLLELVTGKKYPAGGMRNEPGPLSGLPLASEIFEGKQKPRRITYSQDMELLVGFQSLEKFWWLGNGTIILDGNWTPDYPSNSQFIPDFAYKYVRPCGLQYCYFNLLEDLNESVDSHLSEEEVERLRRNVFDAWNNNTVASARITRLDPFNGRPDQVAIWTHYGASGPFLNKFAEPLKVMAQCWCHWIDDDLNVADVTHVIFNPFNGGRLTQAPMPSSLHEELWQKIGFFTDDFEAINTAQWRKGLPTLPLPLLDLAWNIPIVQGLQSMNNRTGFLNWANIAKYPFDLAIQDRCPQMEIFTAPTPQTQVTNWILSVGFFNNPTAGSGGDGLLEKYLNETGSNVTIDNKVRGCVLVGPDQMVCPTLANSAAVPDAQVPITSIEVCWHPCILWDPDA